MTSDSNWRLETVKATWGGCTIDYLKIHIIQNAVAQRAAAFFCVENRGHSILLMPV